MQLRLSLGVLFVLALWLSAAAASGSPQRSASSAAAGAPFGVLVPQTRGQSVVPPLVRAALAARNGGDAMSRTADRRQSGTPPASGSGTVGTRAPVTPPSRGSTPALKPLNTVRCKTVGGWRVCETIVNNYVAKVCRSKGKRKTCTWFAKGHRVRSCTWKGKKRTCKRFPSGVAVPAGASTLNWQGWPSSIAPTVGLLAMQYPLGHGTCSATVVDRSLLVTAAHCLYNPAAGGFATAIIFLPGMTWDNAADPDSVKMPWSYWNASNWWVPEGWRQNADLALDYGLVEIPPAQSGPISQFTGTWTIQTGIRWGEGARVYTMGYPSSGFWDTAQGYNGRGQYACDTVWSPPYYGAIGSGYELWSSCTMNRGSSGGPWFVQLNNGSWVIGGVTSQCFGADMTPDNYCNPYSSHSRAAYLDGRFLEFWNAVQPLRRY